MRLNSPHPLDSFSLIFEPSISISLHTYTEMSKSSSIKVRSDLHSNQSCFSMKLVRHNPTWVDAATSTWGKPICGWSGGVRALNWYYHVRRRNKTRWRDERYINWYFIDCIKGLIHNTSAFMHEIYSWGKASNVIAHLQLQIAIKKHFLCWKSIFKIVDWENKKNSVARWFLYKKCS